MRFSHDTVVSKGLDILEWKKFFAMEYAFSIDKESFYLSGFHHAKVSNPADLIT
jgi:hypothetical protein